MLNTLENLIKLTRERKSSPVEGSYTNKLLADRSLCKAKVSEEIDELIEAVEKNTNKIQPKYKINTKRIQNKYMQNILQILKVFVQGGIPPCMFKICRMFCMYLFCMLLYLFCIYVVLYLYVSCIIAST